MTVLSGAQEDAAFTALALPRTTEQIVEAWMHPETGLQFVHPVDLAAVRATASLLAQFEAMGAYLEAVDPRSGRMRGPVNHNGVPRPMMKTYASTYTALMSGLRSLGATPSSRAAMMPGLAAGVGVASQLAARRAPKAPR